MVLPAAPERGEERVPGNDIALRHRIEHPARRSNVASAAELADALVITEEAAGGEGGGAVARVHRDSMGIAKAQGYFEQQV
jgi:hypothetical protein